MYLTNTEAGILPLSLPLSLIFIIPITKKYETDLYVCGTLVQNMSLREPANSIVGNPFTRSMTPYPS